MRAATATALVLASVCVGCSVQTAGAFDDISLQLGATAVAVLDEHEVLQRAGAFVPVQRAPRDRRVHLWLSGADLPEGDDWGQLNDERLLDVRHQLAAHDLLVISNLSFSDLKAGDDVIAGSDDVDRPFDFSLSHRPLSADLVKAGLGGLTSVEVQPIRVDEEHMEATLFVRRQRAPGQPAADIVTGEVVITLALGFSPERLAEANLGVVAPIAACGQERGPGPSLSCKEAARQPVVDESAVR